MLIIFGALKIEIAAALDLLETASISKAGGIILHKGTINHKNVIVVITGMGKLNAQKAVGLVIEKYLKQRHLPRSSVHGGKEDINILAAGFCGSTSKRLKAGDIVFYNSIKKIGYSDASGFKSKAALSLKSYKITGSEPLNGPATVVTGGTVPHIITLPQEKKIIGSELGVEAIDLESYWIGKKILSCGLPFYCVRSVSDALEDRLPGYFGIFSKPGIFFRIIRSCFFSIISPRELRSNILTLKNIKKARSSLDLALRSAVSSLTSL